MNTSFELHPKLAADTTWIVDLPLCRVLLMEDARFAWLILVPRISELREIHEVPKVKHIQLMAEIDVTSTALQTLTQAYKLNVAALGNQVPQLHIHIIARHQNDDAWPNPVWGFGTPQAYATDQRAARIAALKKHLNDLIPAKGAGLD